MHLLDLNLKSRGYLEPKYTTALKIYKFGRIKHDNLQKEGQRESVLNFILSNTK